jgi:lipopolysaccharide export system protein LptA
VNVSVERLRIWLLAGAGLLVMVVVVFLGYAHYRAHRFLTNLPQKLGVDIRRETNNVTYSQSVQGRTIYTIHAAKAVERSDGKMTLHDVGIVLYGRKQDRADRIYGDEFEYDQAGGIVRAVGEVHIDLQAPEAADAKSKMDYAAGKDLKGAKAKAADDEGVAGAHEKKDERLIHVTTSGLVFLQKLGVAATDKDIEFASGGITGHAVGADYNSDTGVVILHSAVRVNGLQHERPAVLTASHAVLDRPGQTVVLSQAKYVSIGGTSGAEGRTTQAQHVVVHLRNDGTAERVEADGEVTLTDGSGGSVVAPRGEMVLNAQNQPQSAVMTGGIKFSADKPLRRAKGEAGEGRAVFDKAGHPEHAVITGAVHLHEWVRTTDAAVEPWSERELNAGTVDLALITDSTKKTQLRDAKAIGNARLKQLNVSAKSGTTSSEMTGDVLTAHFVHIDGADHIAEVHGDEHTSLRKVNAKGVVTTSAADSLVAHFRPVAGVGRGVSTGSTAKKASGETGLDDITDATEQGHVVMTKVPVKKAGDAAAPEKERVTAERVVYDGDLERATLTGNVQVDDGSSVLWADRVVTEQQSGDATAEGSVKVSYGQTGSADEPAHVLAERAEMKHDSETAIFHGVPGRPARLWQGTSQVDAPVLEFDRKQRGLLAHGEGQGAPMAVHAVMVKAKSSPSAAKSDTAKPESVVKKLGGSGATDVIRIASRELTYSDEARKAEFTGGVDVESEDGSMRADRAVVYLQPASTGGVGKTSQANGVSKTSGMRASSGSAADGNGFMGGKVEKMVATGQIEMQQPGRRATGEQLVYTASDGMFVLTGTATALAKVVDDQRGSTVTGTSLRLHSGDEKVVVSNGGESGVGQRVRTETRVKNKQ